MLDKKNELARHNFDEELRKEKRNYALNKTQNLTCMKHVDMTSFWKAINQLNIRKIEKTQWLCMLIW